MTTDIIMIEITGYLCRMKYEGDRVILIHSIGFWERIIIWLKHPDYKFHRTWIGNKRSLIKYFDREPFEKQ